MPRKLRMCSRKYRDWKKRSPKKNPITVTPSFTLEDLHKTVQLPSPSWCDQSPAPLTVIRLCKISSLASSSKQPLVITHCLSVIDTLEWSLFVHNREVKQCICSALTSFPNKLTAESLSHLLSLVDALAICVGQPDDNFVTMASAKKGVMKSRHGDAMAILDDYAPVLMNGKLFTRTIRTVKCELLVNGVKCRACSVYRVTLRTMYNRWSHRSSDDITDSSSHVNIRYMNTPEKKAKILKLKKKAQLAEKETRKLQSKLEELTRKQGECVDKAFHGDLLGIMQDKSEEIKKAYPEGSFQRVFWEQQLCAASVKDSRQVRWHPLIIRWCLNLKLLSSSAYHATRSAGFIKLPSERTLRDYTHYFKSRTGFQLEVNQQLQKEAKLSDLPENRLFCALLLDEMKLKENLIYDKFEGEIIGFTNLGCINDEILNLERECQSDSSHPPVAKQLLVVMVRGIFFKLDFPYAHFGSESATGELLFPLVWEAIRQIEAIGLKVICITADGASSNRKFFRMHGTVGEDAVVYKTQNVFAKEKRWIYFFSDPPHLMKTTRNCLSHSGWSGTRLMTRNGKYIEWKHVRDLYEKLSAMALRSKGLSLVPKLKSEHINLTSFSRMRVDLAAQVLSKSVAEAMAYFGDPATAETEFFILQFDRFFDCLNVRSLSEWARKKKPDLKPYTSPKDERLEWLENDFLHGYIDEWEGAIKRNTQYTASEQRKMGLSAETIEGLRITVKSFVEMTRYLLSQPGGEELFLLSERITQDPLENYFGKQRARGGRCDNPSLKECLQNAVAIRAQRSMELDRVQGNCRRKRRLFAVSPEVDDTPLPKRKRSKKN